MDYASERYKFSSRFVFLSHCFGIINFISLGLKSQRITKDMAAATASRRSIGQLLKQGWNEIPEVIGSTGMAILGIGIGFYSCHKYEQEDGDNKRYKLTYVIMRPDDPRVNRIRKD